MNEVTNISQLFMCHLEMEAQILKLSAWVQTLGFVLEGLDAEGSEIRKSDILAVRFANRYPAYSEMLFLALSGLQDCEGALENICEKEQHLITAGKEAPAGN